MNSSDSLEVEIAQGFHTVSQAEWDSLVGPNDPFMTHAFLWALESSGSATADTGWLPVHVLCRRNGQLIGAAPLYLKNHSYGEYIFDWSWAQAQKLGCANTQNSSVLSPSHRHRFRLLSHPARHHPNSTRLGRWHAACGATSTGQPTPFTAANKNGKHSALDCMVV